MTMSLATWLNGTRYLRSLGRSSSPIHSRCRRHWEALTLPMIRAADEDELDGLLWVLGRPHTSSEPWGKPHRGARGGTQWEWVNVEARNRLARLQREADRDSMPCGDNARAFNLRSA
jgi:hypothetical protein